MTTPLLKVEGMTDTRNNPMMMPVSIGIKPNRAATKGAMIKIMMDGYAGVKFNAILLDSEVTFNTDDINSFEN
jgi:hypothetical protein